MPGTSRRASGRPPPAASRTRSLGDLTSFNAADSLIAQFRTSGIDLEASTTYVVVFDATSSSGAIASHTSSNSEDAGGASSWSIADGSLWRAVGSTANTWTATDNSNRIAVQGFAKSATPEPEPIWSATLAADDGSGYGGVQQQRHQCPQDLCQ